MTKKIDFLKRMQEKYSLLVAEKLDAVEDWVDESLGMTFYRKEAIKTLKGLRLEIAKHIFLVTQYPDHRDFGHWVTELQGWNNDLRSVRSRNLTESLLWKNIWEYPLGSEQDRREIAGQIFKKKNKDKFHQLPLITAPDVQKMRKVAKDFVSSVLDPDETHEFDVK